MSVRTNPNPEIVESIRLALEQNDGYCPCRIEKTVDTKCMCKEFKDQIKDANFKGECHCGLYVKD